MVLACLDLDGAVAACGLDEHLITAAGLVKAQDPLGLLQGIGQAPHP
jgi:hypothetical protein